MILHHLVVASIMDNVWGWLADWAESAVKWILKFCLEVIAHSPEPNMTSLWYRGEYHLMLQIGGYVSIAVALGAGITAILRGGLKELLRTFLIGLPIAGFGGVAAIAVITLMQKVDQDMTMAMLNHTQAYFDAFFNNLHGDGSRASDFGLALLEFLIFVMLLLFTGVLWLEMVFRQVMLYMAVLFIPLALAAFVWPAIRQWFVGLAEVTATMVFSKFIIASVMCFGFISIHYGVHAQDSFSEAMAVFIGGLLTIIVACFAAPILIMFVMAPSHDIISRKSVAASTPLGADNSYARGLLKNSFKGVGSKIKPSKG